MHLNELKALHVSEVLKQAEELEIENTGVVTARCTGTFVAVKEGHPAYHRW